MDHKPLTALFEENELNISQLYALYGEKIPAKNVFWSKISKEEISHAASIKKNMNGVDGIVENKFSRGVVKYIMDFVLEEIGKTQKGRPTHQEALRTALRIEQSMLEKKCFDLFTPSNETIKNIFLKLNRETERHVARLQEEMKKNKFTFE